MRRAPKANSVSGNAVASPLPSSSAVTAGVERPSAPLPCASAQSSSATANGASSSVSVASPGTDSTATTLRISPYSPKLAASASAIHGGRPAIAVRYATPTAASVTANHCARVKRSFSTNTPSTTLSSGLMKYPRLASTVWPLVTAHT